MKNQSNKEIFERKISYLKNPISILILIASVGIFLRLYYLPYDIPITLDSLKYFWYANDLALGHVLTTYEVANNGWPTFLSFFFSIFHFNNFMDYMLLQRIISILISVLTIIPIYYLCKRFFNPFYGVLAAALFVFEPHIIQNSLFGLTDPLYILLIITSLVLFTSTNKKIMYASFPIIAFASLVRVEGLLTFVSLSLLFFINNRIELKTIIRYGLVISLFILSLLPMIIFRIETVGNDSLGSRIIDTGMGFLGENKEVLNQNPDLTMQFISSVNTFVHFFGLSLLPYFIILIPLGIYFLFKTKTKNISFIIIPIVLLLAASFIAFYQGVQDTRYFYPLFPLFSILSIIPIKAIENKIKINKELIAILLICIILLLSVTFLHFKTQDIRHEKEAIDIAFYVANMTSGINPYLPESKYLPIPEMTNYDFPILSTNIGTDQSGIVMDYPGQIWLGPKVILTDNFVSLEDYIESGKENGLTHLVVTEPKNSSHRITFLENVYFNDEKYSYLTKIFDSNDHNYNYHLKIYEINYGKFESILNSG
jgi:hypothetical protein